VVIDGHGYRFPDSLESHPFGTHRASYGYTPTFLPRQNVQGDYGDNQQAFWLTLTQKDWSLGDGQRYMRVGDDEARRRFWAAENVEPQEPGEIRLRKATASFAAAAAVKALGADNTAVFFVTATNLYTLEFDGAIGSGAGAHGLAGTPTDYGLITDEVSTFVTDGASIRLYTGSWSTFSASGAKALAYLNNTLYGFADGSLYQWDTAGVRTTIAQFKGAAGAVASSVQGRIAAFGGDLAILLSEGGATHSPELWLWDGTGVSRFASFTSNFEMWDMEVAWGVIFVSGRNVRGGTVKEYQPCIYYWASGQIGKLWEAEDWTTADVKTACTNFGSTLVFNDDLNGRLMEYDFEAGGAHAFGTYTVAGSSPLLASSAYHILHARNQTTAYYHPAAAFATSGFVEHSLFDGDTSLPKHFASVIVDYDEGSDGDGGSVDIAYRLNDLDGSYTTLQTGIVSGTEYTLNQQGRSISIKLTLNKGTSTEGPVVKRLYVRAVPILQTFKRREYILELTGRDAETMLQLRDQQRHNLDGMAMATNLNTASQLQVPVTVHDRFGTYTGVIESESFRLIEVRPEEFMAMVPVRQV
jgi:hypothetical protein